MLCESDALFPYYFGEDLVSDAKDLGEIQTGSPPSGAPNAFGVGYGEREHYQRTQT